ncbi:hypothetical protein GC105_06015 [Alkalibaculum sp. M08DMB]|uniref:Uncharacterized protein n=1 Tax=Alkalibaculum sporogenes TaxID=2655001 RepID=A0A6A7K779_9FIRM|nr:hypothetical protein [Alkalibaculum sporogenes]MPW25338.1 hypothetical protein [Alkalibaculum sporogenes]
MNENKEKRQEIFNNYKESIKRAKFAPLTKYALNVGNPSKSNEQKSSNDKDNKNIDEIYLEYKIKKLEEKLSKILLISMTALVLAIISLIIIMYNV